MNFELNLRKKNRGAMVLKNWQIGRTFEYLSMYMQRETICGQ